LLSAVDVDMTGRPTSLDRRLLDAVRTPASLAVIPVITGACGSGRTERLRRLQQDLGARASQYIDLERVSTTPERCLRAIIERSPFVLGDGARPASAPTFWGARPAFDALLTFLMNATHADGSPAVFLLDEVLEVRTFESFPGLRSALAELARAIAHSRNRFIVSTRFAARAKRWIDAAPDRFELVPLTPLSPVDVRDAIAEAAMSEADEFAPVVQALADGRPAYTTILLETLAGMRGGDPISALAASMARGGELDSRCRFSYELRLHRARGYGALKAILDVLADEEPLTLTQIAQRLGRTPGSTKDYLSWLQDVDMLACTRKRYSYADPVLRLWVRIHAHPEPPDEEFVAREVQAYACERLQAGDATTSSALTVPPLPPSGSHQAAQQPASAAASSSALTVPPLPASGSHAAPQAAQQATSGSPQAAPAAQPEPSAAPASTSTSQPAQQPALAGAGAIAAGAGAGGGRLQPSGIIEID
jgi:hypothetical protein